MNLNKSTNKMLSSKTTAKYDFFKIHTTTNVDLSQNPPFLLTIQLELSEKFKDFLNASKRYNLENNHIFIDYNDIRMAFIDDFIINVGPSVIHDSSIPLSSSLLTPIVFKFESQRHLKKPKNKR